MVVSANPLERNHVHNLARPEANITGTVTSFSELPIDQSTQFQLVVNLKTARALGFDVPASIVARADELV